jgi:hypothetical protein
LLQGRWGWGYCSLHRAVIAVLKVTGVEQQAAQHCRLATSASAVAALAVPFWSWASAAIAHALDSAACASIGTIWEQSTATLDACCSCNRLPTLSWLHWQ